MRSWLIVSRKESKGEAGNGKGDGLSRLGDRSYSSQNHSRKQLSVQEGLGANEFGLNAAGDFGFALAGDHVDFAADTELAGEVETWFD